MCLGALLPRLHLCSLCLCRSPGGSPAPSEAKCCRVLLLPWFILQTPRALSNPRLSGGAGSASLLVFVVARLLAGMGLDFGDPLPWQPILGCSGWDFQAVCCSSRCSLDGTTLELLKGSPAPLPGFGTLWHPFHQISASPRGFGPREFPSLPHLRAEHPLRGFCSPWAGRVLPG